MRNWFKVFFLFFVLGLLVYFNSLNNKFLIDDYPFLHNPVWSNMKYIPSQWNPYREQSLGVVDSREIQGYYRPMQHMVLDFCYDNFKYNYWKYHLLNLFLFVFASSLIFLLVEKLTGNFNLALLTGLFYLVHPINGIDVNYISASVFPLQVIFIIGTILLLWEALERNNDRGLYALSLLFSFLSLFLHESGVMAPFYISTVILLLRKGPFKKKALYLFPYFLIVLSYLVFRFFYISLKAVFVKQIALLHMNGWQYLANLFHVFIWYILQLFYPRGVVLSWTTPILYTHIFWYVLGACLLPILFLLFFIRSVKEKILQTAIIWLVAGFAPVCLAAFIIPENGAQIEPHWFVISSIGFFIIAAYYCVFLLDRIKIAGMALIFILIVMWGLISHANNELWADERTYALYWSQQAPGLKSSFFYLADAYQRQGIFKESRKYYGIALAGYTSDTEIYNNIGNIDEEEGHFKEAESNYIRALKIYPNSAAIYNNLGDLYLKEGQLDKAKVNLERSLLLNPLLIEPRRGLASILLRNSEYQKATDLCLKNLGIVSNDPQTFFLLVQIFIQEKDLVNLKKYAYLGIGSITDPKALTGLGIIMAENNYPLIAMDCYERSIHIAPDFRDAYLASGILMANLGHFDEALNIWRIGSSLDPTDNRFIKNIIKIEQLRSKGPQAGNVIH